MCDKLHKIWEENEQFLRRNGIKSLRDEEAFYRAQTGWACIIGETEDWLRSHYNDHLVCDLEGYRESLQRLEEIWDAVCSCDTI